MKVINLYTLKHGGIKVEAGHSFGVDIFPVNIKVINKMSQKEVWDFDLFASVWTESHPFVDDCYVIIKDKKGNILLQRDIDNFVDGDSIQNYFHIWSIENKGAFGVVAGSNDGTSGEWVDLINKNKLRAIIFEPLKYAYDELSKFYLEKENVILKNKAISVDGGQIKFYEQPNNGGVCSTTSTERAKNSGIDFVETIVDSESVRFILENYRPKWVHLDLEGMDYDIVMEIIKHDELHPDLIIYEHLLLNEEKEKKLLEELNKKNYIHIQGERLNSMAIKNKQNQ